MNKDTNKQDTEYMRSHDVERRASIGKRVLWRIEAMAWDLLYWLPLSLMSPERASNLGGWVGRKIGPLLSQHKVALENIALAFPDWDPSQIKAVALSAWESAGRTAGELPHLPKLNPYRNTDAVEVVGTEGLDAIQNAERGAVLVSGHFANWEIMAAAICNRPVDCLVTYRAVNNPHIDRRLNKARRAYGISVLVPKGIGTRALMKALKAGRSVAIMNDQKFREGLPIPFFGRDAMTAPGPARLAKKYAVPIVPMSTIRIGPAKFRVTVHPPIIPVNTNDLDADVRDTVVQITQFIEAQIRDNPGQWFWMHRRWPK